jgi:hypothetical protein
VNDKQNRARFPVLKLALPLMSDASNLARWLIKNQVFGKQMRQHGDFEHHSHRCYQRQFDGSCRFSGWN